MVDEKFHEKVGQCIDVAIPENEAQLDEKSLPLPFRHIPPSISSLHECAEHQMRSLLNQTSFSAEDEDAIDDGFVLCDLNIVKKKLQVWRRLFPRVKPFYALKCNPDPMVAAILGHSGAAGFDCASVAEIRLALQSTNNNTKSIVYANPQRAEKDLETALDLKIQALTFDGPEELRKVHRAYQVQLENSNDDKIDPPNMVLRILVPDEASSVPLGEKFGAPPPRIQSLTELAVELGLPIIGISFHCGSGNHSPVAYRTAIELASEAMQTVDRIQSKAGLEPCWLLDIGGGYPGCDAMGGDVGRFCASDVERDQTEQTNVDTADKIAEEVVPLLDKLYQPDSSDVQFISEPGRYFVEGAFALCSRIYRIRDDKDKRGDLIQKHYYIAQGVQGVFKDCILCNESFTPIPLKLDHDFSDSEKIPSSVHGPSGEDYDVICRDYPLPVLDEGDWLLFDRMGAYTLSIAARNGRPPIRYVMGGTRP